MFTDRIGCDPIDPSPFDFDAVADGEDGDDCGRPTSGDA
jgi:hypothetical protein